MWFECCHLVDLFLQNITSTSLEQLDARLNLTSEAIDVSLTRHLPLGTPALDSPDVNACLLTQTDYVTGFSYSHLMPLWSAFTVTHQVRMTSSTHPQDLQTF